MAEEIKIEPVVNTKEEIGIGITAVDITKESTEIDIKPVINPKQ